jgi:holliday junction DNA helicase RuvA
MISYIEGQVLCLEPGFAVVKVGGVGYHVLLNKKALEQIALGQAISLFTHTHMRQDALELYGFYSRLEKQIFLMLISVSGIGPKLAQGILSSLSPADLIHAIVAKDIGKLSSIPSVGKKTAERLSLELKEKVGKIDMPLNDKNTDHNSVKTSLEMAIKSLGFTKSQSENAIINLGQEDLINLPLEDLIRKALKLLSGSNAP